MDKVKFIDSLINFIDSKSNNGKLLCAFGLAIWGNIYIMNVLTTGSIGGSIGDCKQDFDTARLIVLFGSIFPCISLMSVVYSFFPKMYRHFKGWFNQRKTIEEGLNDIPCEYTAALKTVITENIFIATFGSGPEAYMREISHMGALNEDPTPKVTRSRVRFHPQDVNAIRYLTEYLVLKSTSVNGQFTRYKVHPYAKKIYSSLFKPEYEQKN